MFLPFQTMGFPLTSMTLQDTKKYFLNTLSCILSRSCTSQICTDGSFSAISGLIFAWVLLLDRVLGAGITCEHRLSALATPVPVWRNLLALLSSMPTAFLYFCFLLTCLQKLLHCSYYLLLVDLQLSFCLIASLHTEAAFLHSTWGVSFLLHCSSTPFIIWTLLVAW